VSRLPEGWKIETIGEFCDILDNLRIPISSAKRKEIEGDIPYYGANGIQGYVNDFIFNETLVLLAEDGGHFNEYQSRPIAYMVHGKSWINNHTHVLRAKNGENYFLFYSLVHKDITSYINGGTRAKLNRGELVKIPLILPPLEEQKKIAEILSTVDEKIAFVDKSIEETQTLKKGLMQKLLTEGIGHTEFKESELGRIPKSWEIKLMKNVVDINPDSLTNSTNPDFQLEYIDIASIEQTGVVSVTNMFKFSNSPSRARRIVKKYDVLLSTVRPYLKSFAIIKEDKNNLICSTGYAVLRAKIDTYYEFIYQFILTDNFMNQVEKMLVGSNYPAINSNDVKNIKIPIPPLEEQKQIAEILSTTDEKLENLKAKKEAFEELKKGLMQKLLTGETRV